jgi:hypothetical protein
MKRSHEKNALNQVVEQLEKLFGKRAWKVEFEPKTAMSRGESYEPDLIVEVGGFRFLVEFKASTLVAPIAAGIEQLKRYPVEPPDIRLLVTPFMGDTGIAKCAEAGISWLDLSGNADVSAPGLRLYVRGEKNKFISPGRNENPFAPKSSRIARHLLYQPSRLFTQRELAEETELGEGFVSRIVKSLEAQQLVARDSAAGRLSINKHSVMLDAWQQGYDFKKHEIVRGHVAGRSGEEIQGKISKILKDQSVEHAVTGLGAAWLYLKFAAFRTVSFYLRDWPDKALLEQIGFRENSAGANVWLIIPKDPDVFFGVESVAGIPAVHRIQVWLDLKFHPERSEEAAAELRKTLELS